MKDSFFRERTMITFPWNNYLFWIWLLRAVSTFSECPKLPCSPSFISMQ